MVEQWGTDAKRLRAILEILPHADIERLSAMLDVLQLAGVDLLIPAHKALMVEVMRAGAERRLRWVKWKERLWTMLPGVGAAVILAVGSKVLGLLPNLLGWLPWQK